jgi:hypothetical protein
VDIIQNLYRSTGLDKDLNRESRTGVDNTYTVDPGQKDRKYSGPGQDRILSILRNMTGRTGVGNTQTTRGGQEWTAGEEEGVISTQNRTRSQKDPKT